METPNVEIDPSEYSEPVEKKRKTNLKTFKGGHGCCAVDCHNKTGTEKKISFFHVVRSNKFQQDMWIQAIKRRNKDGSDWVPTASTRICGVHFRLGQPSSDSNHPDFVPSKFNYKVHSATEEDIARNQRVIINSWHRNHQKFVIYKILYFLQNFDVCVFHRIIKKRFVKT